MDTRSRRVQALILKSRDYREQDKLLYVASAEAGIEVAIARGARKAGGSLRGLAQPYCRAELLLSPTKGGISFVQEGVPLESYVSLLDGDLSRFAYAAYMCELLLCCWPENKPQPELYALILAALTLLKLDDEQARTTRMFELRLLYLQGWLNLPEQCSQCGAPTVGRRFCLSPQGGGLLCENCTTQEQAPLISAGAVQTARRLLHAPLTSIPRIRISNSIAQELASACFYYLDYYLDYAPRARRILQQLLDE